MLMRKNLRRTSRKIVLQLVNRPPLTRDMTFGCLMETTVTIWSAEDMQPLSWLTRKLQMKQYDKLEQVVFWITLIWKSIQYYFHLLLGRLRFITRTWMRELRKFNLSNKIGTLFVHQYEKNDFTGDPSRRTSVWDLLYFCKESLGIFPYPAL